MIRRVSRWADELAADPRVWRIVDALAKRLEHGKRMNGSTAINIMSAAFPDSWYPAIFSLDRKWRRRLLPEMKRQR